MAGYTGGNTTGFASPAGDSLEGPIELADIFDLRPPSRYPVRVARNALASRGILAGDILIADAATPPAHGRVAIVTRDPARSAKTMSALDAINARFGRGTLRPASTGIVRPWEARQQQLSPRYTTQIGEIMIAQAF